MRPRVAGAGKSVPASPRPNLTTCPQLSDQDYFESVRALAANLGHVGPVPVDRATNALFKAYGRSPTRFSEFRHVE